MGSKLFAGGGRSLLKVAAKNDSARIFVIRIGGRQNGYLEAIPCNHACLSSAETVFGDEKTSPSGINKDMVRCTSIPRLCSSSLLIAIRCRSHGTFGC